MEPSCIAVLDNGACTVKCGRTSVSYDDQPRLITNAVVRSRGDKATYIGHEFDQCRDFSSLHYRLPFEKGYLVDWDAQKAVWDGIFSDEVLKINPSESSLLITEPYFNLPNLQEVYDQFVFEEYEFHSYFRSTPAALIPHGTLYGNSSSAPPECMLVVDSGFSFTHVVPIMEGSIVWSAVKRLDVGGKLLTNRLKELVSFRQWNMMDETYIMNEVKESCCYVSVDYRRDLDMCRWDPRKNPILQEYILPNFSANRNGRIRKAGELINEADQILYMNNERFSVPETIFHPSDIELQQQGLPGAIASSISLLPEDVQGLFWVNIGLIGGNTKFPGFCDRLMLELRSLAPSDVEVKVYTAADPTTEAYKAALAFARNSAFPSHVVTRAEYQESGSNACRRKFKDWRSSDRGVDQTLDRRKGKAPMQDSDEEPSSAPRKGGRTRNRTGIQPSGPRRR
ncbi:actin-like protein Arp6 [Gloeophyllum trabeum ATCC 11539]|uniref:Actin-like protein ARP6 n=1 Tax=Gloeophyllum trabeum (strain ATCC 11539 / FP-39264 / Madison 617) TaxID=670483 RepID=S7Q3Q5_GLOTA|nr:actin-like protein Arp6 [Gloeophyllum trabeum ATCC 11539]EPQ54631.1 actin-like protein Arp6 [Gloeophyllum trabeum ATCC 11539]